MKMLIQFLKVASLACVFVVLNSCNDDLILVEPSKEATPVIYGFLSLNDTATYLRVERSFVSTSTSALDLAKNADSLTYPANVEIYLVRTSSNERYVLQKVDGNTEGYRREAGAFATTPNYLYKIKNSTLQLKGNEEWRVEVQRKGETKPLARATTRVISTYEIVSPLGMNVASSFAVSFETKTDGALRSDLAARFYAIRVIFNYEETVGSTTTKKNVVWQAASNERRAGTPDPAYDQQNFSKNGREFYEFLGNAIPVTAGASRIFKDMEIEIIGGGQEVVDFLNVGLANLGITGSQTIPIYSNIVDGAGNTALGIFGSRYRFSKKGFFLNDASLESLKTGTFTRQLNFR
jgi:hypothetical protein